MCILMYIGSDKALPLKPWNSDNPDFHVSELSTDQKAIKKHFSVLHIRITGSYEKCGCAFNYGREFPEHEDDPKELELANISRRKLAEYLTENRVKQIYPCWAGEELKQALGERTIGIQDILKDNLIFENRKLIHLKI